MKRIALYMAAAAMLFAASSCTKQLDDLESRVKTLEDKVAALEKAVSQANSNIEALQASVAALEGTDWVLSVEPIVNEEGEEIGYQLNFHSGKVAKIYHGEDGEDGEPGLTPRLLAKKDSSDGKYYWYVDYGDGQGYQPMLDENGQKIPLTGDKGEQGVAPQLKIEDGYWYVSYDGENWTQLGKATGEDGAPGEPGGDSIFSSVKVEGNTLIMTLHDGQVISLPIGPQITITFDVSEKIVVVPGTTRTVNFVATSNLDTAYYEVFTSDDIKARIVTEDEKGLIGHIDITASEDCDIEYAKLLLFASDGYSLVMKRFVFEEDQIKIVDDPLIELTSEEGMHTVHFMSNSDYTVTVDEEAKDWITIYDTKLMQERSFTFYVTRNEDEARKANITVSSVETGLSLVFTVSQAGQAQIMTFTHNLTTIKNPGLTGNTETTRIKYGDGKTRYWEEDATYTYKDGEPEHTVTIVGKDLTGFSFDALTGLQSFDLTDF